LRSFTGDLFICTSHVTEQASMQQENSYEPNFWPRMQPRKCYLCGEMAFPWIATPENPVERDYFFNNLVELNENQRARIQQLINSNSRASICRRHYRERTKRTLPMCDEDANELIVDKSAKTRGEKVSRTKPTTVSAD
ncbi:hypothetical protein PMAYCL1PPCAC_19573, partial [Pristionchus mayeri]